MSVNKVVYGDNTLIDLTGDTVAADTMLAGTTAHDKSGAQIQGSIQRRSAINLTMDGYTMMIPAGYYAEGEKRLPSSIIELGDIRVEEQIGYVKVPVSVTEGYVVEAQSYNLSKAMNTQGAQTIIPGRYDQVIPGGVYLTGEQRIVGSIELVPENIRKDVDIFGVIGTYDGGITPSAITITNNTENLLIYLSNGTVYPYESYDMLLAGDYAEKIIASVVNVGGEDLSYINVHISGYNPNEDQQFDLDYEVPLQALDDGTFYMAILNYDTDYYSGFTITISLPE